MTTGLPFLEQLADNAHFGHSERDPTSESVKGPRPFYYHRRQDKGMDILTFTDPLNAKTAKMYRYSKDTVPGGVNLAEDNPTVVGEEVVTILLRYQDSLIGFSHRVE